MVRGRLKWDEKKKKMVRCKEVKKRVEVHNVNQDTIDPIQSPISHKKMFFESKSAYRRHLKAHGFRETGGEHLKDTPRTKSEEDIDREYQEGIDQDFYDIKYDRIKFSEQEKELHKQEERTCRNQFKTLKPR
jgi:hypothetical protein